MMHGTDTPKSPSSDVPACLATLTAEHTSLEKLLTWCMRQTPPLRFESMIKQDEFTSDIIVPFENLYLVYDTN